MNLQNRNTFFKKKTVRKNLNAENAVVHFNVLRLDKSIFIIKSKWDNLKFTWFQLRPLNLKIWTPCLPSNFRKDRKISTPLGEGLLEKHSKALLAAFKVKPAHSIHSEIVSTSRHIPFQLTRKLGQVIYQNTMNDYHQRKALKQRFTSLLIFPDPSAQAFSRIKLFVNVYNMYIRTTLTSGGGECPIVN